MLTQKSLFRLGIIYYFCLSFRSFFGRLSVALVVSPQAQSVRPLYSSWHQLTSPQAMAVTRSCRPAAGRVGRPLFRPTGSTATRLAGRRPQGRLHTILGTGRPAHPFTTALIVAIIRSL